VPDEVDVVIYGPGDAISIEMTSSAELIPDDPAKFLIN